MARRSRDSSPVRRSRSSSRDDRRFAAEREPDRSAPPSGVAREDQDDREHRAFHARDRARQLESEDREPGAGPPRR